MAHCDPLLVGLVTQVPLGIGGQGGEDMSQAEEFNVRYATSAQSAEPAATVLVFVGPGQVYVACMGSAPQTTCPGSMPHASHHPSHGVAASCA